MKYRNARFATFASTVPLAAPATTPRAADAQVAYVDAQGPQWRQMTGTTGLNWNQVDAVCPTAGGMPCSGLLGGGHTDGWVWATQMQVMELVSETVPEIADTPSVRGSAYDLHGLSFFGGFKPTFESTVSEGPSPFVRKLRADAQP
ncbi:MAG: hypothetical protein IT459_13435 [Planctomycetes bacterium]|nr:hypothetical protein [Planctomycetota bacterium]